MEQTCCILSELSQYQFEIDGDETHIVILRAITKKITKKYIVKKINRRIKVVHYQFFLSKKAIKEEQKRPETYLKQIAKWQI